MLGNFTALVAVNNTLVVMLAGRAHAASSWPCNSLLVSLDMHVGYISIYVSIYTCIYVALGHVTIEV